MSHITTSPETIARSNALSELYAEIDSAKELTSQRHWEALAPALATAWSASGPIRAKVRRSEILTKEEQVCLLIMQEAIHAGITPWQEWPEGKALDLPFSQSGSFEYVGTPWENDELKHCFVRRVGFIRHDGKVIVKPVVVEGQPDD